MPMFVFYANVELVKYINMCLNCIMKIKFKQGIIDHHYLNFLLIIIMIR